MPPLPHNQRAIAGLTALNRKRTSYHSKSVPGLTLEIMPSGKKTWRVRYRTAGGRRGESRAYTIGDANTIKLGEAIDQARAIRTAVKLEGADPHRERALGDGTFDDLFAAWLEQHAKPKKKSWQSDEGLYRRHVQARMGRKIASELTRSDIANVLDSITKSATGIQANRAQSLISAIFNWAVNEGRLEHTPTFKLPKRGIEIPRERVLTHSEIRRLWTNLGQGPLGPSMEQILRLALLTGQRRTEIAEARKSEFELEGKAHTWTIPGSRTKNGIIHQVPLPPLAAELFSSAIENSDRGSEFVFPGRGQDKGPISPHAVTRAMARLCKTLGIQDATVHDLRRTVGTGLARLGVSKDIRARILNHVDGARSVTDAVYNQHEFTAEKRGALEAWQGELMRLVTADGGKY